MADFPMNGRGYAPQAGSYQAYQGYQQPPQQQVTPPHAQQPTSSGSVKAAAALTSAALSLALLVGVGVWSYQLIARDVAGVPVVRAVQGEMRIRPEEPGGAQALNQGLSVNSVAAAGGTAGPSDRIVLAPEPIDLSNDSAPLIDQLAAAQPRFAPSATPQQETVTDRLTLSAPAIVPEDASTASKMASIEALAAQIAAGATPLTTQGQVVTASVQAEKSDANTQAAPMRQTTAPLEISSSAIARDIPGPSISLRPKIRPAGVRTASLTASITTTASVNEVSAASIPAGTRLVQLGAYESPEIARKEWTRFTTKFSEYMDGKDRVVQKASSGGRTFYRLRAMGFTDLADARRFCSALTAQKTDCIPVVTR
jgi:hypothetical protein